MNRNKINYSWRLKTRKMTYILAGKLNNNPFIMVDKVVNFNPNEPTQTKIYQSVSNPNIIISLTGVAVLMDEIKKHDVVLHQQGQTLAINNALMNQFATILITKYTDLCDNYVYVIDRNNLTRYDLKFLPNNHTQYANCTSIIINNGEFLYNTSNLTRQLPVPADAEKFSRFWLKKRYVERYEDNDEKYDINEYFKEGFDFFTVEE